MIVPSNYRELRFHLDGKERQISGMARPDFDSKPLDQVMRFLQASGCKMIIGLHPTAAYAKEAKKLGIRYIKSEVKDFEAPSIKSCENVYDIIKKNPNLKIAIHCGEGFGRTGTILAALKLKEFIMDLKPEQLEQEQLTDSIYVGHYGGNKHIRCTPLVRRAIEAVRAVQGSENSVEVDKQITMLCSYQQYLITTQKSALKPSVLSRIFSVFAYFINKIINYFRPKETSSDSIQPVATETSYHLIGEQLKTEPSIATSVIHSPPINYREVLYQFGRTSLKVMALAKPDFVGKILKKVFSSLKDKDVSVVYGLDSNPEFISEAQDNGIEYIDVSIPDFTSPHPALFEHVYAEAIALSEQGKFLAIHCRAGMGRTGTVLAALKLKELALSTDFDRNLDQITTISLALEDEPQRCSRNVKAAIEAIRAASSSNLPVEVTEQLETLKLYEQELYKLRIAQSPLKVETSSLHETLSFTG